LLKDPKNRPRGFTLKLEGEFLHEEAHGKFHMSYANLTRLEDDADFYDEYLHEDLKNESDHSKYWEIIGFKVKMERKIAPFIMKYYLPAAGIVLVSQISFLISPNQLPGRVALLVTLFLVLTNIFTRQQVTF
jgi:hypothetical protein